MFDELTALFRHPVIPAETDSAAVAPRQTRMAGRRIATSASSHGRHAFVSEIEGFLCRRNFPRGSNLKCLTRVRDVHIRAIDARFDERFIQQFPAGTDKGMALQILLIARLFANEQNAGGSRTFPEHRLRRMPVKIASLTSLHRFPQNGQRNFLWNESSRRAHPLSPHYALKLLPAQRIQY